MKYEMYKKYQIKFLNTQNDDLIKICIELNGKSY